MVGPDELRRVATEGRRLSAGDLQRTSRVSRLRRRCARPASLARRYQLEERRQRPRRARILCQDRPHLLAGRLVLPGLPDRRRPLLQGARHADERVLLRGHLDERPMMIARTSLWSFDELWTHIASTIDGPVPTGSHDRLFDDLELDSLHIAQLVVLFDELGCAM